MRSDNDKGFVSVLNNRYFAYLWVAQTIGLSSQNGIHFVQMVLIEHLTGSTTHMGLMILAFSIPGVLFSAIAGVVVDRLPRKLVLDVSNVLRILTVLSYVPVLRMFDGWQMLIALYFVTFVISSISQFFAPALYAEVPRLIGEDKLLAANNLFNLTYAISQAAGMIVLAPLAVKLIGIEGTFIAIAITYIISSILIALVPGEGRAQQATEPKTTAPFQAAWNELREGWSFVADQRSIYLPMVQLTLIATLIMVMAMLAPGFATRVLGMAPEDAVFIFAPAGFGMFISTLVLNRYSHLSSREGWVNLSLVGIAVGFGALGFVGQMRTSPHIAVGQIEPATISITSLFMVVALSIGFFLATANTVAQTALQERSPAYIRGRVYAVQFLLANLISIPPLIGLGGIADLYGIPIVCYILAISVLATWVASMIHTIRLHRAEIQACYDIEVEEDLAIGRRRILIVGSQADDGTRRSGQALAGALTAAVGHETPPRVMVLDGLELLPSLLARAGRVLHAIFRRWPMVCRRWHQLTSQTTIGHYLEKTLTLLAVSQVQHILLCHRPDVIVSMQPLLGRILGAIDGRLGSQRPIINVVTDLNQFHPLWVSTHVDWYVVPSEAARDHALDEALPRDQIRLLGVPIDKRYASSVPDAQTLRTRLDWPADLPTILVVAGANNGRHFFDICVAIAQSRLPAHLAIVAGQNAILYARSSRMTWEIPTDVYGYLDDLPELMRASDVLVTRGGSVIISEAMAAGLPIILIDPPGRQGANARFVADAGIGVNAPEPRLVAGILREWLRPANPTLRQMAQRARRLSQPRAAEDIAALVLRTASGKPLVQPRDPV